MGAQLLILAAGMGRRFGGLKQLDLVGPARHTLMDYTVFDALRSGFDRVVLVIRRETESEMRSHVEWGFGRRAPVRYAFQTIDATAGRSKPWGTAQAVLTARDLLTGPFAVVNADDFYGAPAIAEMGRHLTADRRPGWAMVGYPMIETLPAEGCVSRALVRVENGWMRSIEELHGVSRETLPDADARVSMNLWGFDLEFLEHLERGWQDFLAGEPGPDDEYPLPTAVGDIVATTPGRVRVLEAAGMWCGMTSAADGQEVRRVLAGLVAEGRYPERLWVV
ncbi:MAG: NTP transferase domain-containing protein [Acidobacteria bacterium]|nr:NTP transferase domain-containing protein [Acidobacteriota bacterium]NIM63633.1 NTP transferase domain-containing protein [Acidobacteriota bacterium]NIO59203.1 NTP transferase domain-containing protein [Acidobacteriota bacterium]NIQ30230.1 NTP transferase domain-containing protein [Acidobacteriota bacterium]NIQ85158.1 NTP transferase domain-containing protein [Acidobacteriota bacterium]